MEFRARTVVEVEKAGLQERGTLRDLRVQAEEKLDRV